MEVYLDKKDYGIWINVMNAYYINYLKEDPNVPIHVEINSSILDGVLKYVSNFEKEKYKLIYHNYNPNGTIIVPMYGRQDNIIVINSKQFESDDCIHTYFHELTHVYDYRKFAFEYVDEKYEAVDFHKLGKAFFYWTEFHARRVACILKLKFPEYIKELLNDTESICYTDDDFFQEMFGYKELLRKDIIDCTKNKNEKHNILYFVMQFFGRCSVWQDFNKNIFNKEVFIEEFLFEYFDKSVLVNLYETLIEMKDYNSATIKLEFLNKILESIKGQV